MADVTSKENIHSDLGDHGHSANDEFVSWATARGNWIIGAPVAYRYPLQSISFGIGFVAGQSLEEDILPDLSVPSVDRVILPSYFSMGASFIPATIANLVQETWHRDDLTAPSYPVPCDQK